MNYCNRCSYAISFHLRAPSSINEQRTLKIGLYIRLVHGLDWIGASFDGQLLSGFRLFWRINIVVVGLGVKPIFKKMLLSFQICIDQTIIPYIRDLRSFVIRFDFESYVRFEIRFELKNDSQVPTLYLNFILDQNEMIIACFRGLSCRTAYDLNHWYMNCGFHFCLETGGLSTVGWKWIGLGQQVVGLR